MEKSKSYDNSRLVSGQIPPVGIENDEPTIGQHQDAEESSRVSSEQSPKSDI